MIKNIKFKDFIFIFLIIFSFCQCSGNSDSSKESSQAKGIVLAFHDWPEEEERAMIFEKLEAVGLKQKSEIERFKTWVFEWPELREGTEAEKICEDLSDLFVFDYCEPDYLLYPTT